MWISNQRKNCYFWQPVPVSRSARTWDCPDSLEYRDAPRPENKHYGPDLGWFKFQFQLLTILVKFNINLNLYNLWISVLKWSDNHEGSTDIIVVVTKYHALAYITFLNNYFILFYCSWMQEYELGYPITTSFLIFKKHTMDLGSIGLVFSFHFLTSDFMFLTWQPLH